MAARHATLCPLCRKELRVASFDAKVKCPHCPNIFVPEPLKPAAQNQPSEWAWSPGEEILPGYVVEKMLGHGGFGEVYRVKRQQTNQLFAVKKARFDNEKHRSNFLAELQTWITLPGHPNLVACRFFRTIGDDIAIFADYVDGDTLARWIRQHQLITLDAILDVAIQFAWGLHVLHQQGLIHQDVKPGNVLMTAKGQPKICDFGLSRARAVAEDDDEPRPTNHSILVSNRGRTEAYCSPEQANRRPLSRKTDMWSWGISVLEMFMGYAPCVSGVIAAHVLEEYREKGARDARLPKMPASLADLLQRCFQEDPANRWASMYEIAENLELIFARELGRGYEKVNSPVLVPPSDDMKSQNAERRTVTGMKCTDPTQWVAIALRAAGRESESADGFVLPALGQGKACIVAQLATLENARIILDKGFATGHRDCLPLLGQLCLEKAMVHHILNDSAGESALCDHAYSIFNLLVGEERNSTFALQLGRTCLHKTQLALDHKNAEEAKTLCAQAIEIFEANANQNNETNLSNDLARAYLMKSSVYWESLEADRAWSLEADLACNTAIRILDELAKDQKQGDLENLRAEAYWQQARVNPSRTVGLEWCQKAIDVFYERAGWNDPDSIYQLARSYSLMGEMLRRGNMTESKQAVRFYNEARSLFERLVNDNARVEFSAEHAHVCAGLAMSKLWRNRDLVGAEATIIQAIEILEHMMYHDGRDDVVLTLAKLYRTQADILSKLEAFDALSRVQTKAIDIYEKLVRGESRSEFSSELAKLYVEKADSADTVDLHSKLDLYSRAFALLESAHVDHDFLSGEHDPALAQLPFTREILTLQNQTYLKQAKVLAETGAPSDLVDGAKQAAQIAAAKLELLHDFENDHQEKQAKAGRRQRLRDGIVLVFLLLGGCMTCGLILATIPYSQKSGRGNRQVQVPQPPPPQIDPSHARALELSKRMEHVNPRMLEHDDQMKFVLQLHSRKPDAEERLFSKTWIAKFAINELGDASSFEGARLEFRPIDGRRFDVLLLQLKTGANPQMWNYQLDSSQNPKAINLTYGTDILAERRKGCYSIEDDGIVICIPADPKAGPPARVEGGKGTGCWLWYLKPIR